MLRSSSSAHANLPRNEGTPLHVDWFEAVRVNLSAVERRAATLPTRRTVKKEWQAAWLVKAITLHRPDHACRRRHAGPRRPPLRQGAPARCGDDLVEALGLDRRAVTVGAVCVYPTMVAAGGEGARRLRHSGRLGLDRLSGRPDAAAAAARGDPLRGRRGRRARSTSSSPARMC